MAKYLFRASLNPEGIAGVLSEGGTARRTVVKNAIESLGGTIESFYFVFGDDDVIVICELPDNETAAAFAMVAGGHRELEAIRSRGEEPRRQDARATCSSG